MNADEVHKALVSRSLGLEFDAERHRYEWDGKKVSSVTDITRRWSGGGGTQLMQLAAARGKRVERAVQAWYEVGPSAAYAQLEPDDAPFFDSFAEWFAAESEWIKPRHWQTRFYYSPGQVPKEVGSVFSYTGTIDILADVLPGYEGLGTAYPELRLDTPLPAVLDLKTMAEGLTGSPKEYKLQLAGYGVACEEIAETRPVLRGLLCLQPGRPGWIEWRIGSTAQMDDATFVKALAVAWWFREAP